MFHSRVYLLLVLCLVNCCKVQSFAGAGLWGQPSTRLTTGTCSWAPSFAQSSTSLFGKKEARAQGNERKNKTERVKKVKDDVIEVEGVVIDSLPNAMFRCTIDGTPETQPPVLATISGKIRKNFVKILVGDKVLMELVRTRRFAYRFFAFLTGVDVSMLLTPPLFNFLFTESIRSHERTHYVQVSLSGDSFLY
jgi:translation initiation factor IF-1